MSILDHRRELARRKLEHPNFARVTTRRTGALAINLPASTSIKEARTIGRHIRLLAGLIENDAVGNILLRRYEDDSEGILDARAVTFAQAEDVHIVGAPSARRGEFARVSDLANRRRFDVDFENLGKAITIRGERDFGSIGGNDRPSVVVFAGAEASGGAAFRGSDPDMVIPFENEFAAITRNRHCAGKEDIILREQGEGEHG